MVVQPEAHREVEAIRRFQTKQDIKLGQRFIKAFEACLADLALNPSYQFRKGPYRHVMLKKLPYRVVYELDDGTVYIYQVRHMSRKPHKKFGP